MDSVSLASRAKIFAAGFTLIELIVSVTVAAVLLSTGVPALTGFVLDSRRSAAVADFVAALQFSRNQALVNRKTVSLCRSANAGLARPSCAASTGWEAGWIVFEDADADGVLGPAEILLRRHEALDGKLTLHGNSKVAKRITFRSAGITGNNGRLALCDRRGWGEAARIIVVSVGGRIKALTVAEDSNSPPLPGCDP